MKPLAKDGATVPLNRPSLRASQAVNGDGSRADPLERILADVRTQLGSYLTTEDHRLRDRKLEALAEFAAGAAHEINTPLAIISGQAQHLLRSEDDPERRRGLEKIISQAQRVHVLFRDLMTYARPPVIKPERVAVAQVTRKAVEALAGIAAARKVRLKLLALKTRLTVDGDPALLEAAIAALICNGLEAAPLGGWVRVSLTAGAGKQAVIVVEDNGRGLTNGQREHLFDPFFSGRTAGRGVGLGLSKAWRIAQLHGGDVHALSAAGRPTRFELVLPTAAPKQQRATLSTNGHVHGRKHDNATSRRTARR